VNVDFFVILAPFTLVFRLKIYLTVTVYEFVTAINSTDTGETLQSLYLYNMTKCKTMFQIFYTPIYLYLSRWELSFSSSESVLTWSSSVGWQVLQQVAIHRRNLHNRCYHLCKLSYTVHWDSKVHPPTTMSCRSPDYTAAVRDCRERMSDYSQHWSAMHREQ